MSSGDMGQNARMSYRCMFFVGGLLFVAARTHAQALQVTSGNYFIAAHAQAYTSTDGYSDSGNIAASAYSRHVEAHASYNDPDLGLHTADGNTSLHWYTSSGGDVTTLTGGVGGVADAVSYGLDTYADAGSSVEIFFNITTPVNARLDSEGTYNSDLYVWDGSAYVAYEPGLNGPIERVMGVGSYRWTSSAGSAVSGYNYYSAGIYFSVEVRPVPEPATYLALCAGMVGIFRRRTRPR